MRREIAGIFLFFLVVLTFISLLSFHPSDPSIHHLTQTIHIKNLFGLVGAHLSGFFIGLFGIGSFWIPILLLLSSIHLLKKHSGKAVASTFSGGFFLIIATSGLFAFQTEQIDFWGSMFPSGGIIGCFLKDVLFRYANFAGGNLILIMFLSIGFIMATGYSLVSFLLRCWAMFLALLKAGLFAIQTALKKISEDGPKIAGRVFSVFPKGFNALKTVISNWFRKKAKAKQDEPEIRKPVNPAPPKKEKKVIRDDPQDENDPVKIIPPRPRAPGKIIAPRQEVFEFMRGRSSFRLPPLSLLDDPKPMEHAIDKEYYRSISKLVENKLEDFGVKGKVSEISPGPVITTYEYKPAPGIKISKIVNLTDDLALALSAISIRIIAPIPGKDAIGIEIPNAIRETVSFKEIVASKMFEKSKSPMTLCLGKDIVGQPVVVEMNKMPHLLIAGATGAGKSVGLNVMITSLLYKSTPEQIKLLMIDPKRIELSVYDGIPHLITPVVTDMKKATHALFWAVREMEHRYELLAEQRVRNIEQYNKKIANLKLEDKKDDDAPEPEELPYVIVVIDEFADLMMVASRDIEVALTRLAQMARAAGIHLILATQRPSVDVLTGIIKANFPTRISFQVSSKIDSRTIIDSNGAENLLGNGDMLFLPPGTAKLQRIHGAYVSDNELQRIIEYLKEQKPPEYNFEVTEAPTEEKESLDKDDYDERYDEAVALITRTRQASISSVQRHLRIGYNRAARIIEVMEKEGIIGPADGAKPREVLVGSYDDMSG
ncbi:MAG: DNA translocase FtsK 4TM domain-containing protein [Proteobacteria bacterium]|nr:DNA translocase FtsK 4TM domain-containing protein [Pseudomonadota bacterium]